MDKHSVPIDVILFGGAFDPPHQGHVDCLRVALSCFPAAEAWIIPTFASPTYKEGQFKVSSATFAQRLEMCRLAFAEQERMTVRDLEEHLQRPNFTVATLEHLKGERSGKHLALLLGQDQLASFTTWKNPRKILELASLIVMKRGEGDLRSAVETMVEGLGLSRTWKNANILTLDGGSTGIALIEVPLNPAESTQIRAHGIAGAPAGWLPQRVLEYIKQQNLYS